MIHQLFIKWNIRTVYHPRSPSAVRYKLVVQIAAAGQDGHNRLAAAYSAAVLSGAVAVVALAVAADSVALLVVAGPNRYFARSLDS